MLTDDNTASTAGEHPADAVEQPASGDHGKRPDFLAFEQVFGAEFDADVDIAQVARWACREGFAVLPVHPRSKKPLCPLSDQAKRRADREAEQAAYEAKKRHWGNARHTCGVHHALTEPEQAHRAFQRLAEKYEGLNLGIEVGRSRVVVVDCDQASEVEEFATLWAAQSGDPDLVGISPTVLSPGVYDTDAGEWVHKGGGHWHFMLPEGVDFSEAEIATALILEGGKAGTVYFKDRLIITPPSVREEGAYEFQERACEIPPWLLERIQTHIEAKGLQVAQRREYAHDAGDSITAFNIDTAWEDALTPAGWEPYGVESCNCGTWTRPGSPGDRKSAVAHEAGCEVVDTEDGLLHVWSDTAAEELGGRDFPKLKFIALTQYGGDNTAAMRALGIRFRAEGELDMLAGVSSGADQGKRNEAEVREIKSSDEKEDEAKTIERGVLELFGASDEEIAEEMDELSAALRAEREDGEQERGEQEESEKLTWREKRIRDALADLIVRDEARRRLRQMQSGQVERPDLISLGEFLDTEDSPQPFRIDGLMTEGANIMLSAQYKTGKSMLVTNLIRCLVDEEPFLDHYKVTALAGDVVLIDDELDEDMLRRNLRKQGIRNVDRVRVVSLRGRLSTFDLLDASILAEWAEELSGAGMIILDCLRPVLDMMGLNEHTEAGRFLIPFDELVKRSGAREAVIVHHMGHSSERARGDSRLRDWPDAEWRMMREDPDDPSSPRYFSAYGRGGVNAPESELGYEELTGRLYLTGNGNRKDAAATAALSDVIEVVAAQPGLAQRAIERALDESTHTQKAIRAAVKLGVKEGGLRVEKPNKREHHYFVAEGSQ